MDNFELLGYKHEIVLLAYKDIFRFIILTSYNLILEGIQYKFHMIKYCMISWAWCHNTDKNNILYNFFS